MMKINAIVSIFMNMGVMFNWRYWFARSIIQLQVQYKQTALGFAWEPLSLLFVTFAISLVWSTVLGERNFINFYIYLFAGFYFWTFISSLINGGVNVFTKRVREIKNENSNLLDYILMELMFSVCKLLLIFPFFLLIMIVVAREHVLIGFLSLIVGLSCISVSAIGFMAIFGSLAVIYRDVVHVIQSIMRLAFLLTPVIWRIDVLGDNAKYIWLNPFYVYIELCRGAFLSGRLEVNVVIIGIAQSVVIAIAGMIVLKMSREKIIFNIHSS